MIPAVLTTWTGFRTAMALPALLILVGQAFWKEVDGRFAPDMAAWPAGQAGWSLGGMMRASALIAPSCPNQLAIAVSSLLHTATSLVEMCRFDVVPHSVLAGGHYAASLLL